MIVCIAEKPMLGRAIADAIPGELLPGQGQGAMLRKLWHGEEIDIIWCFGHMLKLKDPEDYDPSFSKWSLDVLPMYWHPWEKKISPGKEDRVKEIEGLLSHADWVIHAGDLDDEGQLIVDELLDFCHYSGRVMRLNTVDVTPAALLNALENMDDNTSHVIDGKAASSRQICDTLFGYNLTRFYSLHNPGNGVVSVGRVQTPTLGLVVQRDKAIAGHQSEPVYTLRANLNVDGAQIQTHFVPSGRGDLSVSQGDALPSDSVSVSRGDTFPQDPTSVSQGDTSSLEGRAVTDRSYLEEVRDMITGADLTPCQVTEKESLEAPPLPFNTSKLNLYCNARWGMSPKDVLAVTQSLRDNYRAITYNRSECRYLSEKSLADAPDTVLKAAANLGLEPGGFDTSLKSKAFDDSKLTGPHTGIIPTAVALDMSKLTQAERRVYEAIALHYLAQFIPPAVKVTRKLTCEIAGHGTLTASSSRYTRAGWRDLPGIAKASSGEKEASRDGERDDESLNSLECGSHSGTVTGCEIKEGKTRPPEPYTQATLEEDMTRIARYCTDSDVRQQLLLKDKDKTGENGSIGTSATRPYIIAGLIQHGLLEEYQKGKKKYLRATPKGQQLYSALPEGLRSADVTARWWCLQEDIRSGKSTSEDMEQSVLGTVKQVIESGNGKIEGLTNGKGALKGPSLGKCPKCGEDVFDSGKTFRCGSCSFKVWKDNALFKKLGKDLNSTVMKSLLKSGRVTLKGCKSARTGKTYDPTLIADFSGDRVQFSFAPLKKGS